MRAARRALALVMLLVAIASMGCLRRRFNLCAEDPPHPDCPRDAGPDADLDAPPVDAPLSSDAPLDDSPVDDAPVNDAPAVDAAVATADAATTDAGVADDAATSDAP